MSGAKVMKRIRGKKGIAYWLAVVMLCNLAGCSRGADEGIGDGMGQIAQNTQDGMIKGCYVEQELKLPGFVTIDYLQDITVMEDGSIVISGADYRDWKQRISTDGGETFVIDNTPSPEDEVQTQGYFDMQGYASLPSGERLYSWKLYEGVGEFTYVDATGEAKEFTLKQNLSHAQGTDRRHLWAGEDGNFYLTTGQAIYQFFPEEERVEELFSFEEFGAMVVDLVAFAVCGDYLYAADADADLFVYQKSTHKIIDPLETDTVLASFLKGHIKDYTRIYYQSSKVLFRADGTGEHLYVITNEGIYVHVPFGNSMEAIIDGGSNQFGNADLEFKTAELLADGEHPAFLILLSDDRVYRYAYDSEALTPQVIPLRVYSLYENSVVRKAIEVYRRSNPNVRIEYEVGIQGTSAVTENDAIRDLSTQLASGKGPDVILMDGLPFSSYVEKGALFDLTELREGLVGDEEVLPQLMDACAVEGRTYGIPMTFSYPALIGKKEYLEDLHTLEQLADIAEQAKEKAQMPDEELFNFATPRDALCVLSLGSYGKFLAEDGGGLNREVVTDFLIQSKRIWTAHETGLTENQKKGYAVTGMFPEDKGADIFYRSSSQITTLLRAMQNRWETEKEFAAGYMTGSLDEMTVWMGLMEPEETYIPMPGVCQNYCNIYSLLTVNNRSEHPEEALQFLALALSYDFQSTYKEELKGIPSNQKACLFVQQDRESLAPLMTETAAFVNKYGEYSDEPYERKWITGRPSKAATEEVWRIGMNMERVQSCPPAVYDKILEQGVRYLEDECSVEAAVDEIERGIQMILAE